MTTEPDPNRRPIIRPARPRTVERAPLDLVVPQYQPLCEMLLPLPPRLRHPGHTDRPCGRPAHYVFELDRREWGKMPQHRPIIGHACVKHGKEAHDMPGLLWIKTI